MELTKERKEIQAGVPLGSVLLSVMYLLYTSNIPKLAINTIATLADDIAILTISECHEEVARNLQTYSH